MAKRVRRDAAPSHNPPSLPPWFDLAVGDIVLQLLEWRDVVHVSIACHATRRLTHGHALTLSEPLDCPKQNFRTLLTNFVAHTPLPHWKLARLGETAAEDKFALQRLPLDKLTHVHTLHVHRDLQLDPATAWPRLRTVKWNNNTSYGVQCTTPLSPAQQERVTTVHVASTQHTQSLTGYASLEHLVIEETSCDAGSSGALSLHPNASETLRKVSVFVRHQVARSCTNDLTWQAALPELVLRSALTSFVGVAHRDPGEAWCCIAMAPCVSWANRLESLQIHCGIQVVAELSALAEFTALRVVHVVHGRQINLSGSISTLEDLRLVSCSVTDAEQWLPRCTRLRHAAWLRVTTAHTVGQACVNSVEKLDPAATCAHLHLFLPSLARLPRLQTLQLDIRESVDGGRGALLTSATLTELSLVVLAPPRCGRLLLDVHTMGECPALLRFEVTALTRPSVFGPDAVPLWTLHVTNEFWIECNRLMPRLRTIVTNGVQWTEPDDVQVNIPSVSSFIATAAHVFWPRGAPKLQPLLQCASLGKVFSRLTHLRLLSFENTAPLSSQILDNLPPTLESLETDCEIKWTAGNSRLLPSLARLFYWAPIHCIYATHVWHTLDQLIALCPNLSVVEVPLHYDLSRLVDEVRNLRPTIDLVRRDIPHPLAHMRVLPW